MCQRYEHRATVITSNKPFVDWGELLGDAALAAAMIDRFLHHYHVLNLKGDSYRMRARARGETSGKRQSSARVGPP